MFVEENFFHSGGKGERSECVNLKNEGDQMKQSKLSHWCSLNLKMIQVIFLVTKLFSKTRAAPHILTAL